MHNSNAILHKAVSQSFAHYQDYLHIWRYWIETLLQTGYQADALLVLKKALFSA